MSFLPLFFPCPCSIHRVGPSSPQALSHLVCKLLLIRVVLKHDLKFGERVSDKTFELQRDGSSPRIRNDPCVPREQRPTCEFIAAYN
jgi:hypothetical protein